MTDTQPTADVTPLGDPPPWDDRPRLSYDLHVTISNGPFQDSHGYETGQTCPGCDQRPTDGDEITRIGTTWWHLACFTRHMRTGGADAAWQALGTDLAARPSRYSVAETRAITRNLLRLATKGTR
ncbi:hypothetical protein GCM10009759_55420 [Kitasatospora saccharophila]|uniref:PARP-type domain-containing protein n=1 Tax=Kitasatospora saccharophila TaxID=407973 RepID=A0ABN2XJ66_9ACTN